MPPEEMGGACGPSALFPSAIAPSNRWSYNPARGTMSITHPFVDNAPTDREERALVARACSGDREALADLVRWHQGWIYNIALRMLYHPQDAEDATQEILIKVVTQLSSFEGRSSFRTWLYRRKRN